LLIAAGWKWLRVDLQSGRREQRQRESDDASEHGVNLDVRARRQAMRLLVLRARKTVPCTTGITPRRVARRQLR
jgi:hypothetical protein